MGEVVNLRRHAKAKARADRQTEAAANRAAHGRTGAEKRAARTEAERADRTLDAARLVTEP